MPYITVAAILGAPLSITTCSELSNNFAAVLLPVPQGASVSYLTFTGAGQTVCYELQAVWGLTIVLCILFAVSAISAAFLWLGDRRLAAAADGGGGGQMEMGAPKASVSSAPSFASRSNSFDGGMPPPSFSSRGAFPAPGYPLDSPMPPAEHAVAPRHFE